MSQKKKNLTSGSGKVQGKKTKSSIDLCKVQGNILKGFNKPNVRLVFFRFGSDIDPVIVWLGEMSKRVLNTKQLVNYSKMMHKRKELDPNYASQDVLLHVSLSRSGITRLGLRLPPSKEIYQGLGLDSVILSEKVDEYANALGENDVDAIRETKSKLYKDPFYAGMIARKGTLDDSSEDDPAHWQEPYKSEDMDALFIVAADQEDDLDQYVAQLISEAAPKGITCVGLEIGKAIFNEQGKQVEHFGFRDGISQPLIVGIDDLAIEKRKNYVDKFYPEDFVLFDLPDDFRWANNGSFLVFRKLEQNVEGFWNFMKESCGEVNMGPEDLAARLMGRWKSGATLMHNDNHDPLDPGSSERNDFQFLKNLSGALKTDDPKGASTPVFSHIRLANPRDAQRLGEGKVELPLEQKLAENNQHRMLRRGIPYGPQWAADVEKNKKHERGLLFACYCRDIHQQFEWVQMNWFKSGGGYMQENDPHARIVNLLQGRGYRKMGIEFWVTLRGGGYFFSPSVYALKHLSKYIYKSKNKAQGPH